MKPHIFFWTIVVLLGVTSALPLACGNNNSPSSPSGGGNPPTNTPLPTLCVNPSNTPCTSTFTPTATPTATITPTSTQTRTSTVTFTLTITLTPTWTPTGTPTKTPTVTNTGTPSFTPTITNTPIVPVGIFWDSAGLIHENNGGTISQWAWLYLQVNGVPDASATIVLTGSNLSTPVTLPYLSTFTNNGQLVADYYDGTLSGLTYTAGQTYALTSYTYAGTASATVVASGNITVSGGATVVSWATEGNNDAVYVYSNGLGSDTYTGYPDLNSPVTLPGSAYPSPGTYQISVVTENRAATVYGAAGPSVYGVSDELIQSVVK